MLYVLLSFFSILESSFLSFFLLTYTFTFTYTFTHICNKKNKKKKQAIRQGKEGLRSVGGRSASGGSR